MLTWIVICATAASSDPAPASQPVAPPAPAGVFSLEPFKLVLSNVKAVKCLDNLPCWKRRTEELLDGLEAAVRALDLRGTEVALLDRKADVLSSQVALYAGFAKDLQPLAAAQSTPWYREPVLWLFVGAALGIAATVGVVEGVGALLNHLQTR